MKEKKLLKYPQKLLLIFALLAFLVPASGEAATHTIDTFPAGGGSITLNGTDILTINAATGLTGTDFYTIEIANDANATIRQTSSGTLNNVGIIFPANRTARLKIENLNIKAYNTFGLNLMNGSPSTLTLYLAGENRIEGGAGGGFSGIHLWSPVSGSHTLIIDSAETLDNPSGYLNGVPYGSLKGSLTVIAGSGSSIAIGGVTNANPTGQAGGTLIVKGGRLTAERISGGTTTGATGGIGCDFILMGGLVTTDYIGGGNGATTGGASTGSTGIILKGGTLVGASPSAQIGAVGQGGGVSPSPVSALGASVHGIDAPGGFIDSSGAPVTLHSQARRASTPWDVGAPANVDSVQSALWVPSSSSPGSGSWYYFTYPTSGNANVLYPSGVTATSYNLELLLHVSPNTPSALQANLMPAGSDAPLGYIWLWADNQEGPYEIFAETTANEVISDFVAEKHWYMAVASDDDSITIPGSPSVTHNIRRYLPSEPMYFPSQTPDGEDDEDVDQYVEPTGVDFNVETLNLKVGETRQLRWTFKPFATTVRGVTLTSSYPNIATVDDQGLVRAVAAGTTVVTIETRNGLTDTVRVVVEEWEPEPEPEPEPPTPAEPVDDPTLASFADPLPTSLAAGDPVEFTVTIDPKYDVSTLALVGVNWDVTVVDEETVTVTGVMPNSSVTFHFTATETESGTVYKSPDTSIALATEPEPEPTPAKKSSSGGCDAGFAGLALLLAAPLFIRKKD